MKNRRRDIFNKLKNTEILNSSKLLRPYVPETRRMNFNSLKTMLQKEKMVYIKPYRGSQGRGVIKLELDRQNRYHCQHGVKKSRFLSFNRMYEYIRKMIGNESYLVQKGIHLLTYKGLIFDIRVMVQHNAQRKWEVTGIVGRVAHPHKAVTNGSQGGSIYPVDTLLQAYLNERKRKALIATINKIGLQSAKAFGRENPHKHEIGADIALDRQLKPWILEVNWNPDPCPFTKIKDRSMLRKILRYAKFYGKTYRLKCTKAKPGKY